MDPFSSAGYICSIASLALPPYIIFAFIAISGVIKLCSPFDDQLQDHRASSSQNSKILVKTSSPKMMGSLYMLWWVTWWLILAGTYEKRAKMSFCSCLIWRCFLNSVMDIVHLLSAWTCDSSSQHYCRMLCSAYVHSCLCGCARSYLLQSNYSSW